MSYDRDIELLTSIDFVEKFNQFFISAEIHLITLSLILNITAFLLTINANKYEITLLC